jgi:hypothetical protein
MDLYDSTNGTEAIFSCVGGGIALGAYSNHPLRLIVNTTERVTIDTAGNVGVGNTSPGARLQVDTGAVGTKGFIVKGAASQSANLQEWQNSAGAVLASVESTGRLTATSALIYNQSASATSLIVRSGNPSTTYIQEWENYYGTTLSYVDANGNIYAPTVSAGTLSADRWFTGTSYVYSRIFFRNGNLPSVVGNYVELFECPKSRMSPIRIAINSNSPNTGRVYDIVFDSSHAGGSGGIILPTYASGGSSSDDFELEVFHVDANFSRFRLKRTAGTSNRAFQAYINIQVGNTGADAVTLLSGTGTSTLGSTEYDGNATYTNSIKPINASTYSGAGRSLTIAAANGQTSGAGGSIVLQPGLQATTGGNGVVAVRAAGGTAGTDELQIYHDGTNGQIINKDTGGDLKVQLGDSRYFTVARTSNNAYYVSIDPATGISCGNHGFAVATQNHLDLYAQNSYSIRTRSNIIISDPSWNIDVGINRGGKGVLRVTDSGSGGGSIAFTSSTTNISTATNNLALSGSAFQRLNCTTACNLTGVAPPSGGSHVDGRMMRIYNVGTANLTLKHNSTSSDVANRFCCVQAVDIILAPRDYAELIYDGTDGGLVAGQNNPCWRVA